MKKASVMLSAVEMGINSVSPIPVQFSDLIDAGSVERGTDSVCFSVSVCLSACLSVRLSLTVSVCLAPSPLSPPSLPLSLSHTHTHTHCFSLSLSLSPLPLLSLAPPTVWPKGRQLNE